jgi:hypothetical protein
MLPERVKVNVLSVAFSPIPVTIAPEPGPASASRAVCGDVLQGHVVHDDVAIDVLAEDGGRTRFGVDQ